MTLCSRCHPQFIFVFIYFLVCRCMCLCACGPKCVQVDMHMCAHAMDVDIEARSLIEAGVLLFLPS